MNNSLQKVDYMSEEEIAMLVINLNPGNAFLASEITGAIFIRSTIPPENLTLPYGCYYNGKNGITNKHNTKSGAYSTLYVDQVNPF